MSRLKLTVCGAVLLALLAAPAAQASTIAVNFDNLTGSTLGNGPATLGWSFTATTNLLVTDLGAFDSGQDGLVDRSFIGLWDSGGNLLASTILPSGTAAALDDKFRFQSIAGTNLLAGQTYYIGALYQNLTDGLVGEPGGFGAVTNFASAAGITYLTSRYAFGGILQFPGDTAGGLAYFGPNFQFQAVPEPASLLLLGVGIAPFAIRAYRRRASR